MNHPRRITKDRQLWWQDHAPTQKGEGRRGEIAQKKKKKKSKGKLTEPLHGKSAYKATAEVYAYRLLTVHRSIDLKYLG